MKAHIKYLRRLHACSEAVIFADGYDSLQQAWDACDRGDWLLWLAAHKCRTLDQRRKLVFVAAQCARLVLPIYENKHPGDHRMRECLDACEAWSRGEITDAALAAARNAAYTAASAYAYAAADADAAVAAADAAFGTSPAARSAYATYAADAAVFASVYSAAAARDAAYTDAVFAAVAAADAATKDTLKECAVIVKLYYPKP